MSHHKMKRTKALLQQTVLLYPIVFSIPYMQNKSKSISENICVLGKNIKIHKKKISFFSAVSVIWYQFFISCTYDLCKET